MSDLPFNVIFVGAGDINFGTVEGPWNHSKRLEALLGPRLRVLSIVDPDIVRSERRIENKCFKVGDVLLPCWAQTLAHADLQEAAADLCTERVDLVIVGCPPQFRGTLAPGHDMETAVLRAFPRVRGMFIEKPVASIDPTSAVNGGSMPCHAVAKALEKWADETKGNVVSVGYMFRYLVAVQKIREIMEEHHLTPRMINARYYMAYESTTKISWWSKAASGGPIVEQATHLVDLIRYFAAGTDDSANPVIMSSVQATTTEYTDEAGELAAIPVPEEEIATNDRIPRATAAFWRHAKGTIASLCHCVALHDQDYHAEMDVVADGWLLQIKGIYTGSPTLIVSSPQMEHDERTTYSDDPFGSEMAAMIEAVITGNSDGVLSSFRDALRTYELTWAIRRAGERSLQERTQTQQKGSRIRSSSSIRSSASVQKLNGK